jgi:hypothetical protein
VFVIAKLFLRLTTCSPICFPLRIILMVDIEPS